MTPYARLSAVAELLDLLQAEMQPKGRTIEGLARHYFRSRRYAGSQDRRAIIGYLYLFVRHYESYVFRLKTAGLSTSGRLMVHLALSRGDIGEQDQSMGPYGLKPLSDTEAKAIAVACRIEDHQLPVAVRCNVPHWIYEKLSLIQTDTRALAVSLNERAATIVRCTKMDNKDRAFAGLEGRPCQWSPFGFSLASSQALTQTHAYQKGQLEIQDEAAQIASLLVEPASEHQILDYCAGAGGKSLTVAMLMRGRGQVFAADINSKRLGKIKSRAAKADIHNIQLLSFKALKAQTSGRKFDRVIADVPCSGTGTWRRSPALRWRYAQKDINDFTRKQSHIIRDAGLYVKPGGRLLYMTCSLLREENEQIVEDFLTANPVFRPLPYHSIWQSLAGMGDAPETLSSCSDFLLLSPHKHGTDGFFVAILERIVE